MILRLGLRCRDSLPPREAEEATGSTPSSTVGKSGHRWDAVCRSLLYVEPNNKHTPLSPKKPPRFLRAGSPYSPRGRFSVPKLPHRNPRTLTLNQLHHHASFVSTREKTITGEAVLGTLQTLGLSPRAPGLCCTNIVPYALSWRFHDFLYPHTIRHVQVSWL
jgi:hypothetical protein